MPDIDTPLPIEQQSCMVTRWLSVMKEDPLGAYAERIGVLMATGEAAVPILPLFDARPILLAEIVLLAAVSILPVVTVAVKQNEPLVLLAVELLSVISPDASWLLAKTEPLVAFSARLERLSAIGVANEPMLFKVDVRLTVPV